MQDDIVEAAARVEAVANGATINGTYKAMPLAALDAFRDDLRLLATAIRAAGQP